MDTVKKTKYKVHIEQKTFVNHTSKGLISKVYKIF